MKNLTFTTILLMGSISISVQAEVISKIGSGWNVMSAEDQTSYKLTPGYGGQYFDAEYLLYQFDETSNQLTIALQTGFDVTGDNHQNYNGSSYWGGDLFLSFDNDDSVFEYALDFGQTTGTWNDRGNPNNESGSIAAVNSGLYEVSSYNNQTYYNSNPFAMSGGDIIGASSDVVFMDYSGNNPDGYGGNNMSYVKTASFNLDLLNFNITQLDAHWTMSCGNDAIEGYAAIPPASVPEPSVLVLLTTGMIGLLGGFAARRRKL